MISISTHNTEVRIANIYGANVNVSFIFHSVSIALSPHSHTALIVGGDFSLVLNPECDRLNTVELSATCNQLI